MISLRLIGGPTVLIEVPGLRLLTDPTFDDPGSYARGVTLTKLEGPDIPLDDLGSIDAVLLSHDQHADNLDEAGKAFALKARNLITTVAATSRLAAGVGLAPWESVMLEGADGQAYRLTATPARHGPPGAEKLLGDVIGFVLSIVDGPDLIYVTGDTVFYDGVAEVSRRFDPQIVLAFAGAARTRGAFNLTMGNDDLLELAQALPRAQIAVAHNAGWAHFTEGPADVLSAASAFGLSGRLQSLERGRSLEVAL
ncbi:MAG TPA: MBL fold metallo-hydrolase [Sphingomicrobium sp.]|nr:MBL fold metallo-hydrolase [Sphingomicrobium sp.]